MIVALSLAGKEIVGRIQVIQTINLNPLDVITGNRGHGQPVLSAQFVQDCFIVFIDVTGTDGGIKAGQEIVPQELSGETIYIDRFEGIPVLKIRPLVLGSIIPPSPRLTTVPDIPG